MITWMQKNKKYLVVTIWISTIAFVGAGFVGWGAYDFNHSRATSVAKVGNIEVSNQDLQEKYSQIYNYYNTILGGKLDQEQATKMGLDTMALNLLIEENLILNFAKDLGLQATDSDVLDHIIKDPNFQTNNAFDKSLYQQRLKSLRLEPREYEKSLRRSILLNKIQNALLVNLNNEDKKLLNTAFFTQDKLSIQTITANENEIKVDEDSLKKLWETNKNNFKTSKMYTVRALEIPIQPLEASDEKLEQFYKENLSNYRDNEDKLLSFEKVKEKVIKDYSAEQTRTDALKKYLLVKKGEILPETTIQIDEKNPPFDISEIAQGKTGDVIKPIKYDNKFIIAKITKITPPQPLEFEQAKPMILELYKNQELVKVLEEKAKNALSNFKPTSTITINRQDSNPINGFTKEDSDEFKLKVLENTNKNGYVILSNKKAIVYEILEQKLLNDINKNYKMLVEQNIEKLKNNELLKDLTNTLTKRYKIEEYTTIKK